MAANTSPRFIETPRCWQNQVATANTSRDGTGTIATVAAAAANGSRIDKVVITAEGTTTAGVVRLFIDDGSNVWLFKEQLVAAVTPSTSTEVARYTLSDLALDLPSGWELQASTHNAETFTVVAQGGDY